MILHLKCTANLGDFLNVLPVLSGVSKAYGKFMFIIRDDMEKFNGIKEFLMYQDLFTEVLFEREIVLIEGVIEVSSWTRETKTNNDRPIETCRYENWLKDRGLTFDVDDSFTLKVPDHETYVKDEIILGGDRWNGPGIDGRRASWTLAHIPDVHFLDYSKPLLENAHYIKHVKRPFITTFTGISVIADLLNKEQIVLWGEDIRDWDNKPIEYSFEKHFYSNRKSKLMYLGDFDVSEL
jgi:hypothetical protein